MDSIRANDVALDRVEREIKSQKEKRKRED